MTNASTVTFVGLSGAKYQYGVWDVNLPWKPLPANYAFAFLTLGGWVPVYFGETGNIANRMPSHEKWPIAQKHGATHILAHIGSPNTLVRQTEEKDLIRFYNPKCNVEFQLNTIARGFRNGAGLLSGLAQAGRHGK